VKLYPAIDILGGNAVRLVRGDFALKRVYDEDPVAAARAWVEAGAQRLHVVDLDGARGGEPVNLAQLARIAELGVPVQYGGGLRSLAAVDAALAAGAARVVMGTVAVTDPAVLEQALARHGAERVVVAVDVRAGEVSIRGWTEPAGGGLREVLARLLAQGVRELAYTDVDRDGLLSGPDAERLATVADSARPARLIYSGGIGELADLERLAGLGAENLDGVIVGKALYEGRFSIADAQAVLDRRPG
jgi:phosphoribosylformimino-5-aminoimidazole carboxamide ribotide isomerase